MERLKDIKFIDTTVTFLLPAIKQIEFEIYLSILVFQLYSVMLKSYF